MSQRRRDATWVDLQVAGVRWLAFLTIAATATLFWLVESPADPFPLVVTPFLIWAGVAVLYNAIVTALAFTGWLASLLPVGTIVIDILLLIGAYLISGPAADSVGLVVDPFIFLAWMPVIITAIRFNWWLGVLIGLLVGALRAALLLWGYEGALTSSDYMFALLGVLSLVVIAFLSGFISERALRTGTRKRVDMARQTVRELRSEVEQLELLQEITSTLSDTLSFERVLDQAMGVAEQVMARWGARGELIGMVFLFESSSKLRLAASRGLPRHEARVAIPGEAGIVARCLQKADVIVTDSPIGDPELSTFTGLAPCRVAAALPLRAGYENFGALIFATAAFPSFTQRQITLFSDIAARVTVALHNALLYQNLQAEKDRIIEIEEEARRKLSRELHDGPTQSVSAIAMRLNFIRKMMSEKPERMTVELESVETLARDTVQEIRRMLYTLRPLILETQGLVPALHTLADRFQKTDDLNIQIMEHDGASEQIDSSQIEVVFSIVEEALGNARKYSEASLVQVRLWVEGELFVTQVADNGVGFDTSEVLGDYESRGSLGMVNMRERAELVNGSLDVKSAPGHGTTITLVVPLDSSVG